MTKYSTYTELIRFKIWRDFAGVRMDNNNRVDLILPDGLMIVTLKEAEELAEELADFIVTWAEVNWETRDLELVLERKD